MSRTEHALLLVLGTITALSCACSQGPDSGGVVIIGSHGGYDNPIPAVQGGSGSEFVKELVFQGLLRRKGSRIPINLAGALGALLADLGFDPLVIGGLGALGYGMALLAHIVEEIREGVPLRIIPDALGARYAGPPERHLPPDRLRGRK